MDLEGKRAAIRKLIEESARPRREGGAVTRITVIGHHTIVARQVIVHSDAFEAIGLEEHDAAGG